MNCKFHKTISFIRYNFRWMLTIRMMILRARIILCESFYVIVEFFLWSLQMNLTTSREMRIWKIEWLNVARRWSEIRIHSDHDHGGIRVHTQAKIRQLFNDTSAEMKMKYLEMMLFMLLSDVRSNSASSVAPNRARNRSRSTLFCSLSTSYRSTSYWKRRNVAC